MLRALIILGVVGVSAPQWAGAVYPAFAYHADDLDVDVSAEEQALAEQVQVLVPSATLDPRLVIAARRYAQYGDSARDVLTWAGLSDAFSIPLRYTLADSGQALAPVRELLAKDVVRSLPDHVGVGIVGSGGARQIGIVFVRRATQISRFPMRVLQGDSHLLNGRVGAGFKDPMVLLATPDGQVIDLSPRVEHGAFWRLVSFDSGSGVYSVEVQAEGPFGPEVLNLMEVYASPIDRPSETPVVRLRPQPAPVASLEDAEQRAVALINQSRRRAGLSQVRTSSTLRKVARSHSIDMANGGFFGHISPRFGGLRSRLEAEGVVGVSARENVAIALSPEVAHFELLRSPSHLRNMLHPDLTHVGVGVHGHATLTGKVLRFTQIFAKFNRR